MELMPHQVEALKWAEGKDKVLFALDQGLGKTAIACQTIKATERVLVICPASLKLNWERELKIWSIAKRLKIIKKKSEDLPSGPGVVIINYDLLGQKVKKRAVANYDFSNFDRVIVDESQMIKNSKAVRTKIAGKIVKLTKYAILLSGTPMERAMDLYVPLFSLGATKLRQDPFGFKFCEAEQVYLGMRTVWQFRGLCNEQELRTLMKPFVIRMLKEDVTDLPEKIVKIVALDLPKGAKEKKYSFEDIKKDPRPLGFEGLSELIHEQGLRKLPLAVKHIKMRLESEKKVFIVAKHSDVIDTLKEKLSEFNPVVLDGRMKPEQKQESIDTFQNDKNCRVFIGQIIAAGTGITLTAASHVVVVEAEWSYSALMQVIDRVHRIGQTETVTAELLTIHNSIDERMLYTTLEKQDYVERVLEKEK